MRFRGFCSQKCHDEYYDGDLPNLNPPYTLHTIRITNDGKDIFMQRDLNIVNKVGDKEDLK